MIYSVAVGKPYFTKWRVNSMNGVLNVMPGNQVTFRKEQRAILQSQERCHILSDAFD